MIGYGKLLVCGVLLASVAAARGDGGVPPTLDRLADAYWEAQMERYPTRATALGDYRYNDRLTDLSDAARIAWSNKLLSMLADMRQLPREQGSHEDQLTRRLLERAIMDDLLRIECLGHLMPLEPLNGLHISFPLLQVRHPFRDEADFRSYAARLRVFPQQVIDTISNMRHGVSLGLVSPRVIVEKVIPQIRRLLVADVTQSEFYRPVREDTVLSAGQRESVAIDIADAIRMDVMPAYWQLLAYMEDVYLHASRDSVGMAALPNGDRLYAALARLHTTVAIDPNETHAIGLSEVARIRREMARLQAEIGFEGTLDAFLEHMRTDPKYRFQTGEEMVVAADAILSRTKPRLGRLFSRLPKADCVMKEIEAFRAPASPVAYYNAPTEDGSRPGYYYINTYKPQQRLRFTLEALTFHEAVPGHHLQMALDQENMDLPKFRRYARYNAYTEGWGLYAEWLGYDLGGYQDALQRFGQLTFEMWRACRLVVDTGMHAKGWSRQQAIDYMASNTSLARIDIEAEINRYIVWPGQALSYKIGEMRIRKLRKDAETMLGDRFDVRAFHDTLLGSGALPIDVLESNMHEWMSAQAK